MEESLNALLEEDEESVIGGGGRRRGKRKIRDLVAEVEGGGSVQAEVEEILYDLADGFLDHVTGMACKMAKHRGTSVVTVKDFQFPLERNWNLRIPTSSAADSLAMARSVSRRVPTANHVSRMLHVRRLVKDEQAAINRVRMAEMEAAAEAAAKLAREVAGQDETEVDEPTLKEEGITMDEANGGSQPALTVV
ncbi:hypothetical protein HDU99_009640 [Rhizoclosmatium hyalinum]|nr:hypothetical protein HDU99_009640 [Rhizoclosmatium hyalinum]